jgi:hypothetical protein
MLWVLGALALVAVAIWLPREEDVIAGAGGDAAVAAVSFGAERSAATAPFIERWELRFPDKPPTTQTLTLHLGTLAGDSVPARITAAPGRPDLLLERIAAALGEPPRAPGAAPQPAPESTPVAALDVRLYPLGEHLSEEAGDAGVRVIAGAFVAEPAGDWRAYRVVFGENGPQCFLGISEAERSAVLLPREMDDAGAIVARFRALLGRRPAAS